MSITIPINHAVPWARKPVTWHKIQSSFQLCPLSVGAALLHDSPLLLRPRPNLRSLSQGIPLRNGGGGETACSRMRLGSLTAHRKLHILAADTQSLRSVQTGLQQPMRELLRLGGLLKPALSEGEREREGEGRRARMKGVKEKHPGLPTVELQHTKKDEWANDEEWIWAHQWAHTGYIKATTTQDLLEAIFPKGFANN